MKTKVLVTGSLDDGAIAKLRERSELAVIYEPDCSPKVLASHLPDVHVLITRSETTVDRSVIDKAPHLKLIARAAVGVNNIDLAYATERGILVINTPGKNTNSAAELTFALLLGMLRKLPQAHAQIKASQWDRHIFTGYELRHKSIGIVGLGNVGHRVAKFAHGFDMKVYGYDPYISSQLFARYDVTPCHTLAELASRVEILTVHVPLNKETTGMVNADILNLLPKGSSYVVNAARGGVIDEGDLFAALSSEHIAGAAIDTWETEPKPMPALALHPRVWTSPHIGASTREAQKAIGESVVSQVIKALDGGVVDHPVNLPQIGVIDNPLVKPYAILAEKLGSLAGQMIAANPTRIEVLYRGDLAGIDQSLIRLGWMKGYVACAVNSYVSYVNAAAHFENLGLQLVESEDPDFQSYRSAIKFVLHDDSGDSLSLGGIVFDEAYLRLSLINDFYFEVEPSGTFIVLRNEDKPGVIGDVGTLLAREQVNIDSFDLSRRAKGDEAMALIKVDSAVSASTVEKLAALPHVLAVHAIDL